ncbi:YihY/virulence factor BrkB family protein [Methylobacterium gnaphalii]|uniref:Uncharacterized protein n=1 Tax=Methylobacterium gnaphalii TaxID=1010610 RepID=A0A512JQ94_9HYPH|nr:YihY/virulence factor BrkB family protein [Methylobacterium gnaphalii]GEP12111.1 hypothetical protein MGN01_39560 [Methylobacterium gnaphalii]GJD70997.1 hypothetical protein MMMDOFMJ_3951 [Methylobacterium gnaphalii]GLS48228.1 hypothetical protein GCM10007885_10720 [Methylobacterium gnaphalii]
MTTKQDIPSAQATEVAYPAIWTMATAAALIGLVAMPRRSVQSQPRQDEGDIAQRPSPSHEPEEARAVASTEADRGRRAASPKEIPAKGWKDVAMRTYRDVGENRLTLVSAGVTFFALLAIFPAIAALVSIYGLVADAATINENLAALQGIVPSGALDIVGEQVKRLNEKGDATLGFSLIIGIVLSVWSANSGMKHIFDALNIVYNEREKRNFFVLNLVSLGFTAGALLFIVLALVAVVAVPVALQTLGFGKNAWWLALLRWPALLVAVVGGLALIYRYGPSRDAPRWRWVTPGSLIAALLWLAGSLGFSWYVANFGKYNQTYGSLGAAIGFMTWIWLSTTIVLLGAQLNAETEHQTAEDTTVGAPKPLGAREARMADTVGVAT